MTARQRRLLSDWEQVQSDFAGHKNIIVTPVGEEPYEKYNVTYFVNGIYLQPNGKVETLVRHEVEITLHAEYPRFKPVCRIKTPIWHPNFRDGQICIGDIWGAGESLSDIIINIGDMIQYKSWNSFSPLSADAAEWAIKNKHLFPVGNVDLYKADYSGTIAEIDIELFDEAINEEFPPTQEIKVTETAESELVSAAVMTALKPKTNENDFEITSAELEGVEYIPTAQRMQTVTRGNLVKCKKVNFKTVFMKGILWGLIGGLIGFILQEVTDKALETSIYTYFYNTMADFIYSNQNGEAVVTNLATIVYTGCSMALVACGLGLFMGIGEGVYYGSKEKALIYGLIGIGAGLIGGFIFGAIAQYIYLFMSSETVFADALSRGVVWALVGVGVGLAIGLIKPDGKRILYCILGGAAGGFVGGFIFDYIYLAATFSENDTGILSRGVGFVILGLLIGLGIGLLEQFAKAAWLKVNRGEFEGKEYIVFAGTTSIGNSGKNTIVLFKDRLVGPHHCDIVQEGSKYILLDRGTPMGTVVNGQKITRHVLRHGDAIAMGNSVLVFNTK